MRIVELASMNKYKFMYSDWLLLLLECKYLKIWNSFISRFA